ncbi:ClpP/crotonase [Rhizoclosmatium globosum]|uniref:ClpP/crotonase n=1 Tax=Rhizoclosmatium globosum TaxID=329046 RepID=A0A1Y2C9T8_9FUNG|nr:dodecenoyl-CoA isomerase [Rhizoclosmatium sp. JEL0117]ORY43801.1 ClpP/crotonase [Rhizoclosmatium globosum]|eukprot:ORY43801.1 ClpP/crotonase [Rhizoclosmatium globosum]
MASFVTVQKKKEYAIVTLNRGPVNALNLKFWKDLQAALDEVQSDKAMRALIFQSGLEKDIFTAGNDLTELYAPLTSLEKYTEFWTTQNVFLGNLYASRLVTVSVIRGACPAGGCAISMCCDYRIMSKDIGHIGLNEPQIGLTVPVVWMELFTKIVGHRQAELLGFNGSVVGPAEAKRIGLVDLLVPKEELLPTAEAVVSQFLKVPSFGRSLTKQVVHKDLADKFRNRKMLKDQSDAGWQFLTAEPTLKVMKATMDRLAGNSKASKL